AAPRRLDVGGLHVVHPDNSRAQSLHRAESLEDVAGPNRRSETVWRVIGDLYCVFFVFEGNDGGDWPENFFTGDTGVVVDVIEDRCLDVVALRELLGATGGRGYFGLFLAEFLVRLHTIVLLLADRRSHFRIAIEWGTEFDVFCLLGHGVHKFLVDRLLHQDAAAGRADFSLVDEDAE